MDDEQTKKLKIVDLTSDVRKFEIGLFWSRSLFFWGFTSVAIIAYGAAYSTNLNELKFAASCLGIICSLVWTLTNRSSKYWQKVWEEKASLASENAFAVNIFAEPKAAPTDWVTKVKQFPWWSAHFSVSKLAIAFSDFALLAWIGLAFKASSLGVFLPKEWMISITALGTTAYAFFIFCKCGPDQRPTDADES